MMKEKLEFLTKDLGISVTAISKGSGVSYSIVSKYLRGHTQSLKEEYVIKLQDYFIRLKQQIADYPL